MLSAVPASTHLLLHCCLWRHLKRLTARVDTTHHHLGILPLLLLLLLGQHHPLTHHCLLLWGIDHLWHLLGELAHLLIVAITMWVGTLLHVAHVGYTHAIVTHCHTWRHHLSAVTRMLHTGAHVWMHLWRHLTWRAHVMRNRHMGHGLAVGYRHSGRWLSIHGCHVDEWYGPPDVPMAWSEPVKAWIDPTSYVVSGSSKKVRWRGMGGGVSTSASGVECRTAMSSTMTLRA